jgi:hypothetical protein
MYRYAIGIPHIGALPGPFVDSLMGLTKPSEGFYWLRAGGMPVDMARNVLVKQFLGGEAEWLLQVDSDMTFAPASLERLASRGEELISGLCFTRYVPPLPTVFRGVTRVREDGREFLQIRCQETAEWLSRHPEALEVCPAVLDPSPDDALVQADGSGAAFLLCHRRVFEAVGEPWFQRDDLKKGEDFYFFEKARRAGFQLWVDRSVIVGHLWGELAIGPEDFVAYQSVYPLERLIET